MPTHHVANWEVERVYKGENRSKAPVFAYSQYKGVWLALGIQNIRTGGISNPAMGVCTAGHEVTNEGQGERVWGAVCVVVVYGC